MPAESKAQETAARIAKAAKKGKIPKSKLKGASKEMAKSMTEKQLGDFTHAKKGAPKKVSKKKEESYETSKRKSSKGKFGKFNENLNIINFIESILTKNYASANKYLNKAVEYKLQKKIENELSTPLF